MSVNNRAYWINKKRAYQRFLFTGFFLLRLLSALSLFAQPLERVNPYREYDDRIHTKEYLYYFDKTEIQQRGFREAYIIRHPSCWVMCDPSGFVTKERCALADTVSVVCFDEKGRISSRVDYSSSAYKTWQESHHYSKTQLFFDSTGTIFQPYLLISYENERPSITLIDERRFSHQYRNQANPSSFQSFKMGTDSVSLGIAFDKRGTVYDSAFTVRKRYNAHGYLLEDEGKATDWYLESIRQYGETSNRDFRYFKRYRYDSLDRLVYEFSDYNSFYTTYTYTSWGKTWEHHNKKTDSISAAGAEIKYYYDDGNVWQISDGWSLTSINYLESGSKLVTLITRFVARQTPSIEYTEVVYK